MIFDKPLEISAGAKMDKLLLTFINPDLFVTKDGLQTLINPNIYAHSDIPRQLPNGIKQKDLEKNGSNIKHSFDIILIV